MTDTTGMCHCKECISIQPAIVSISDYHGAQKFLLRENSKLSQEQFSLVKVNEGGKTEDIIAYGSAEQIFTAIGTNTGKQLLND